MIAALAAFNLVCSGTGLSGTIERDYQILPSNSDQRAFSRTYRVDLDKGRWCVNACEETMPIVKSTAEQIVLISRTNAAINERETLTVNRESGEFSHTLRNIGFMNLETGKCERAEFGGFPAPRF